MAWVPSLVPASGGRSKAKVAAEASRDSRAILGEFVAAFDLCPDGTHFRIRSARPAQSPVMRPWRISAATESRANELEAYGLPAAAMTPTLEGCQPVRLVGSRPWWRG